MISVNKNKIPFFSVVITTFNRKIKVIKAINSVLKQTEKDYEIIIVDDGSSDNTFNELKEILASNSNIRYLYQSNRGAAQAKNSGIVAATGLFITFLDSDDLYSPYHLEIRKEAIMDNDFVHLFHGGVDIIGEQFVPDKNDTSKMINLEDCVIGGTFFAKKKDFVELGGFPDVKYGEDALLYEKFKAEGLTIGKIENKTYLYHRDSDDSICNNIN